MNDQEFQEKLIEWIVKNVDAGLVPNDEGNSEALVYNMIKMAVFDNWEDHYRYLEEQDDFLKMLYKKYNRSLD